MLTRAVGVLGLLCAAWAVVAASDGMSEPWRLAAAGALLALGTANLLYVRTGHNAEAFTFSEAALAVALALVRVPEVLLLIALSSVALNTAQRLPWRKVWFNAANHAAGVALCGLVLHALGATPDTGALTARDIGSIGLGVLAFAAWNAAIVSVVVSLSSGAGFRMVFGASARLSLLVTLGNTVLGLGILALFAWEPKALALLPPVVLTLYGTYRGYLLAVQDRDTWRQLEAASAEFNSLDESALAESALNRATSLFRANWVELDLVESHVVPGRLYRRDLQDAVPDRGYATLVSPDSLQAPDARPFAIESQGTDRSNCAAMSLRGASGEQLGGLRLGFLAPVKLTRREFRVLTAFAHSVATAVVNARLYEQMRQEAQRKAFEAGHDVLTGLANRRLLLENLAAAMSLAGGTVPQGAVLQLGIDNFKSINDALGHATGDELLKVLGHRLGDSVPEDVTVARLSGDIFAVALPYRTPEQAATAAHDLLRGISQPWQFDGLRLSVEASLGYACYPEDGTDAVRLVQQAEIAMFEAKESRGSVRRYRSDTDRSNVHRLSLAADLRSALENNELVLHFQPQQDVHSGRLVGAEVLVRWPHPVRGWLPPSEFVSIAEQWGLVQPFTLHILERAVATCAAWRRQQLDVLLSVNLSARNLLDRRLPADVASILEHHGLPASRLVLEITETTMMREIDIAADVLAGLRGLGLELSVDDFGTGYSSLSMLQQVAVHELKIDRSFVQNMLTSDNDHAIVRATIDLAHAMGLRVVAEGVETEQLAQALTGMGCDVLQGYHIGRPMPADDLWLLLRDETEGRPEAARSALPGTAGRSAIYPA